jgi:hypothetical protein
LFIIFKELFINQKKNVIIFMIKSELLKISIIKSLKSSKIKPIIGFKMGKLMPSLERILLSFNATTISSANRSHSIY